MRNRIKPFWVIALLVAGVAAVLLSNAYLKTDQEPQVLVPATGTQGWVAATSTGLSYRYPESLGTSYISPVAWPPLVERVVNEYACMTGEAPVDGPVSTVEERVINGRTYCVSTSKEGAAGSAYVTYEYATELGTMNVRLSFRLRYPQCANYNEPEQSACRAGQEAVNVDQLADGIVSTIVPD
jgi:hypothetical protein